MVKENTKTKIDVEKDICHPIYVLWGHTLATECRQINSDLILLTYTSANFEVKRKTLIKKNDVLVDKEAHIEKNIFFAQEVINCASQTVRVQCEL